MIFYFVIISDDRVDIRKDKDITSIQTNTKTRFKHYD